MKAERALIKCLFESNIVGLAITERGRLTNCNDAFLRLLDYTREDWSSGTLQWDKINPPDYSQFDEWITEGIEATGQISSWEKEFYRKDGSRIAAMVTVAPLEEPADNRLYLVLGRKNAEARLQESEEKFRQLAESINDIFWLATPGLTGILYVSPAYEKIWGLSCQSLYDDPGSFFKSIHPEDLDFIKGRIADLHLENREIEFRVVRPDGDNRWLRVRTFPIRNEAGDVYRIAGITRDITERKKSERLQSLLSSIVEWSQDAIIGFGSDGRIFTWNAAAERLLGYAAADVLGQDAAFVWAAAQDNLPRLIADAIRSGQPIANFETMLMTRRAAPVPVSVSISPIREADGRVGGASTIIRDLTEVKKSEDRSREQAALLDNMQEAISIRDLKGRVLYWNKGAERVYGWQADEILGKSTREFLYRQENLYKFDAARTEFLKYGRWAGELPQRTRDGRDLRVACRWLLVRNAAGEPQSILVINTDVTTKKMLEEKFVEKQRVESVGALAAGIAHDLNDVLYPITLAVESLRQQVTDEEGQYLLALLKLNAERGVALIDRVLSFAKGKTTATIHLPVLIQEIIDFLKLTTSEAVAIEVEAADDLWTIQGDEIQLKQVIINLCVNAVDAMPDGGRLRIQVTNVELAPPADEHGKKAGRYLHLAVHDTGVGIPEETLGMIFTPFFTTKKPGEGTGLGLSTTLSIIENCQGYIEVSSLVGQGTTVDIYLPAGA